MGGPERSESQSPSSRPRYRHQDWRRAGHYGETVRGLDGACRGANGRVRTFSLNAKIGRDTTLMGEMRTRINNGKPVLYFETSDAGALFRLTDIYQRMVGGKMWLGMDPPTQDVRRRMASSMSAPFPFEAKARSTRWCRTRRIKLRTPTSSSARRAPTSPEYRAHVGPGWRAARSDHRRDCRRQYRLHPRSGRDAWHAGAALRPQHMFGQIPIVGLFLGGSNEGMFGITYEVSGGTSNRAHHGQSDLRDRARRAAQVLRIPRAAGPRSRLRRADDTLIPKHFPACTESEFVMAAFVRPSRL